MTMAILKPIDPEKPLRHCDIQYKNVLICSQQYCHTTKLPTYYFGYKLNHYLNDELILKPDTKYRVCNCMATKLQGQSKTANSSSEAG